MKTKIWIINSENKNTEHPGKFEFQGKKIHIWRGHAHTKKKLSLFIWKLNITKWSEFYLTTLSQGQMVNAYTALGNEALSLQTMGANLRASGKN